VDQVTEIVAQSYATDAALLAELRATWPPAVPDSPPGADDGYRSTDLEALDLVGAVRLTDRFAVALAADPGAESGAFVVVPLAHDGARWRRAVPGDGLSAFVAGVPAASERAIGVDQTHASIVVGERAIIKWFRRVGPGPSRAAELVAHLAAVGFVRIPRPLGSLTWRSPAGIELTLAQGDAYLSGARDGWDWCLERVPGDPSVGRALGELVSELHRALASPSVVITEPLAVAGGADVACWRQEALATLDQAITLTNDAELNSFAPAMRDVLDGLRSKGTVPVQPVHGDLHVGQVLEWSGGVAVIDFDGNPALPDDANALSQPVERDIAQMLTSLDHVGRVVDKEAGWTRTAEVEAWIAASRSEFLGAVGSLDERLLAAFEVEQECRELVYAARFLPRWRYAPLATLRARFDLR
jgi:maltokinase